MKKRKKVKTQSLDSGFAVVHYSTFGGDTSVKVVQDWANACDYLEKLWDSAYNEEIAERPDNLDECETFHEDEYAQIVWNDGNKRVFEVVALK